MNNHNIVLIFILLFSLVSCAREDDEPAMGPVINCSGEVYDETDKSYLDDMTRAPVASNASNLPTSNLSIYIARTNDAVTADWTTVTGTQTNTVNNAGGVFTATLTTTGSINFGTTQYFNANPSLYSNLVGYYPASLATYPSATNPGKLQWTINGKTDIMYTAPVSGNRTTSGPIPMVFNHQLCWLKFYIQASSTNTTILSQTRTAWGKISQIKILNQNTKFTLTLPSTGVFGGTVGAINTWTAVDGTPTAKTIGSPSAPVFVSQAMVQPMPYVSNIFNGQGGNYAISFYAATPKKTYTIPIKITGNQSTMAGNIHVITLTFAPTVDL